MNAQTEFAALLAGFAAAREEGAAPDGAARLGRIAAQVRRRRLVRVVVSTGAAAAAVLGIAVGVYAVARPDPTPPAETAAPTVLPTPAPTASDEPDQAPTALGEVTVHPLLPSAEPMPEGLLEQTTADWSMVTYYDAELAEGGEGDHPTVLYLLGPDGSRHEVPTPVRLMADCEFCSGVGEHGLAPTVSEWLPGTSLAVVTPIYDDVDTSRHFELTDLLTGEVLQRLDAADGEWAHMHFVRDGTSDVLVVRTYPQSDAGGDGVRVFERRGVDGSLVAAYDLDPADGIQHFTIDGSGRRVAFQGADELVVVDLATFAEVARMPVPGADTCMAGARWDLGSPGNAAARLWLDEDTLVLRCAEGDLVTGATGAHFWLVDLDGSTIDLGGEHPWYGTAGYRGRLLVSDTVTWYELRPDGSRAALAMDATVGADRVVDGRFVYVDEHVSDDGPEPTGNLVWTDPVTGRRGELLELVDAGSRIQVADASWW